MQPLTTVSGCIFLYGYPFLFLYENHSDLDPKKPCVNDIPKRT